MIDKIKESDWKYLGKLFPILLERAGGIINKKAQAILENKKNQEQLKVYRSLYRHIKESDEMIADCFDDHKRSRAKQKILMLMQYEIKLEEEFEKFSDDTKETVRYFMERER
ncbi:MAG: hypothetical protein GY940_22090 [bacterium]|nr:hypothetical protein [bacterium]